MANAKITGTFLSFPELLSAYGTIESQADGAFLSFLKKVAGKDCVLTNFHALNQTFDTAFLIDHPNRPGQKMITFPNGLEKQYMDNVGVNKLVSGSVVFENGTDYIYCKDCGFTAAKSQPYRSGADKFTYGDIYNGTCETTPTTENISGTLIYFKACEYIDGVRTGRMICDSCRRYTFFDEIGNSI
jgi:hypothetical protein